MIRYLGTITRCEHKPSVFRVDSLAGWRRLFPRTRCRAHEFEPGIFLVGPSVYVRLDSDFGRKVYAAMCADDVCIPPRVVRVMAALPPPPAPPVVAAKRPDLDAIEARAFHGPFAVRADLVALLRYARTLEAERDGLLGCLQRAMLAQWNDCDVPGAADNDGVPGPSRPLTREEGYDVHRDEDGGLIR